MKVKIAYAIDLEEVIELVSSRLDTVCKKSIKNIEELNHSVDILKRDEDSYEYVLMSLQKILQKNALLNTTLEDIMLILGGYIKSKTEPLDEEIPEPPRSPE